MRRAEGAALAVLLVGCDGDAEPAPEVDAEPRFEIAPSRIEISEIVVGDGSPAAAALVRADFASSALVFQAERMREGSCRLLTWDSPFCDPACGDQVCVEPGTCVPAPTRLGAGSLTVTGLVEPLALEPEGLGRYRYDAADLFAPGASITVSASGDDVPAFALAVSAPEAAPMRVDESNLDIPSFRPGAGYTFRWLPIDRGSRVRLRMMSDLVHGQPNAAVVECEGPDVGALAVPVAILDEFIDTGNWSCGFCPQQSLTRYRSATTGDGAVEVAVGESYIFNYFGYGP